MSKFNGKAVSPHKTVNTQGHPAYKLGDNERLATQVLASFFGEPKYYKNTDDEIVSLAITVAQKKPRFVANLAVYARKVFNLRSVSHVLTAILAHEYKEKRAKERTSISDSGLVRKLVNNVVVRADDMTEILSCYLALFGKPIPNALKRGISDVLNRFDAYSFAKYSGSRNSLKIKDLINICHPVPRDEEQSKLFFKVLDGSLETPVTWETELSAKGNKWDVWVDLIEGNKLGTMALLRNLRNIYQASREYSSDNNKREQVKRVLDIVNERLRDKEAILKSKLLPFRFLSAWKELENESIGSKLFDSLEIAIEHSIANMDKFKGITAVIVDVSGSMESPVSGRSKMTCAEIGTLLGVMASKISEESLFLTFDTKLYVPKVSAQSGLLTQARSIKINRGGTDMNLPFKHLLEEKEWTDRIILLSDNEANRGVTACQNIINKYRQSVNPNVWIHACDLAGYGTVQFNPNDSRINFLSGWSEKILNFVTLAENGISTLTKTISGFSDLSQIKGYGGDE